MRLYFPVDLTGNLIMIEKSWVDLYPGMLDQCLFSVHKQLNYITSLKTEHTRTKYQLLYES